MSCRRGLHHNRSQQPSVVLDGVTGHSRSLRNCQGFGLALNHPRPLQGGDAHRNPHRAACRREDCFSGFALLWSLLLTIPPTVQDPKIRGKAGSRKGIPHDCVLQHTLRVYGSPAGNDRPALCVAGLWCRQFPQKSYGNPSFAALPFRKTPFATGHPRGGNVLRASKQTTTGRKERS